MKKQQVLAAKNSGNSLNTVILEQSGFGRKESHLTKYNACYFCCAMAHISSLWDLHITQAFDAPSSNLELCDLISPPHLRRSYSLTLLRDALYIITLEIVIWYGAVIAQSGRQFDEIGTCFFVGGVL